MKFKKRQPKIKTLSSVIGGELLFVFGVGTDNKLYQWDALETRWKLQQIVTPKETPNAS